ncbi:MAG: carboxypeptidase-like regulatory domain-containing protein [Hyalangium sp.]|uniref:carboxypeptidase-like regulatory domain-containing protein n=1 Tax=Hyalangium sp. TaxID=2028555 RepID=UPI003899ED19
MKKLVMALVPALMFGCSSPEDANGDGIADGVQDPNNVSVVVPSTPKGTVSGQVLTTQQKPLGGANVSLTVGSSATAKTATTDEAGNFTFQDVPAGAQVLLTFSKDGFASLRASSVVPDSAGNVPINNGNASFGPVLLSELNGQVKINLVGPTGRPAEGAKATLDIDPAGTVLFGLSEQTSSKVVVEAVADAQGVLTFDKVPNPIEANRLGAQYRLSVAAMDTNGDGVFETGGLVRVYSSQTLITSGTVKTESLPYGYNPPAGTLAIDYSNVAALKGSSYLPLFNMIKPGENIYIVFNQPVQSSSVIVGLTDEYGRESLGISKSLASGGTVLTLTPSQAIQAGREYNLYLRAVALNGAASGGSVYATSPSVAFFAGDPANPLAISVESVKFQESGTNNGLIDNGELVYVNFNQVMTARLATSSYAYVFVGADLNNSGKIGDAPGERDPSTGKILSATSGFLLAPAEPTAPIATKNPPEKPVFPFNTSGYTTRFRFQYTPPALPTTPTTYTPFNPTSNIPIYILYSALTPTSDVYESGWGVPQTSDVTISGSSVTPIAVPVAVP